MNYDILILNLQKVQQISTKLNLNCEHVLNEQKTKIITISLIRLGWQSGEQLYKQSMETAKHITGLSDLGQGEWLCLVQTLVLGKISCTLLRVLALANSTNRILIVPSNKMYVGDPRVTSICV